MKNTKLILAGLIATLALSSCKKFLEEDPKSQVTITNYYKTQADAISAVNSIYGYLNSISTGSTAGVYHSSFWVAAGLASDEMENNQLASPQFDQLSTFTYTSQNSALQEVWATNYKAITIANIAISRIPGISMDAALKSRLIGEAKFLRGLLYFNLVRMFGKIPLLTAEENPVLPPVSDAADIYAQVITDLQEAAAALPLSYTAGNGGGRATQGAANSILAKVYLTMENWDMAASTAKKVIDSNQYELYPDFADVFKLANRNGKEAIFSVGFGDANGAIIFWEAGQFQVRLLPAALSVEGVKNAQGWQVPTQYLYNQYDQDDRRRAVTFITEIHDPAGPVTTIRPYIQKYWDRVAEPAGNETSADFPVIRYADVLLIYAEANNELNQPAIAHQYINMVRKRARFNGTTELSTVPDYVGLSQDQFREAILKERYLEFVAEGHRWFDLARMGKLEQKVPLAKPGVTPTAKHYLFPIPQREIDLNKNLVQNTGY
ncbi:MAG: RagB/SusD family nutrient uptake outer membrane protein [Chitinophagaceae bacterium]|nr:MAG: RagB/SusD family nutrient uptake outer membrane protein [Chitinophagaceae bacterium]